MDTKQKNARLIVNVNKDNPYLTTIAEPFHHRVADQIDDMVMRKAVAKAQDLIGGNRFRVMSELGDSEGWRERAAQIRDYVLDNLEPLLSQLADSVERNGGHVFFAKTKEEAQDYIVKVCQSKNAKKIVKSKSMVTEEIGMNHVLEHHGMEVVETDLGEYIVQVGRDKPSHIVVPAIHRDRNQIRKMLNTQLGYEGSEVPEDMTAFVRGVMRPKFVEADVGVTGCNFAIPASGTVCLVTNEGNARMVTTLPKTQIAVMGMERMAPSFEEAEILITMLARNAVGARLTGYNTWLTGPRLPGEIDGPEEFHLVIVDNGRSDILASQFKDMLRCIRCGACINGCPCYREIGGHGYGSIYPGPMGVVLTPLLGGYEKHKDLPYVCTLCTNCDTVCPVKIPLSKLIMKHRHAEVELGMRPTAESFATKMFGMLDGMPGAWGMAVKVGAAAGKNLDKQGVGVGPLGKWMIKRDLPKTDGQAFRTWWAKRADK